MANDPLLIETLESAIALVKKAKEKVLKEERRECSASSRENFLIELQNATPGKTIELCTDLLNCQRWCSMDTLLHMVGQVLDRKNTCISAMVLETVSKQNPEMTLEKKNIAADFCRAIVKHAVWAKSSKIALFMLLGQMSQQVRSNGSGEMLLPWMQVQSYLLSCVAEETNACPDFGSSNQIFTVELFESFLRDFVKLQSTLDSPCSSVEVHCSFSELMKGVYQKLSKQTFWESIKNTILDLNTEIIFNAENLYILIQGSINPLFVEVGTQTTSEFEIALECANSLAERSFLVSPLDMDRRKALLCAAHLLVQFATMRDKRVYECWIFEHILGHLKEPKHLCLQPKLLEDMVLEVWKALIDVQSVFCTSLHERLVQMLPFTIGNTNLHRLDFIKSCEIQNARQRKDVCRQALHDRMQQFGNTSANRAVHQIVVQVLETGTVPQQFLKRIALSQPYFFNSAFLPCLLWTSGWVITDSHFTKHNNYTQEEQDHARKRIVFGLSTLNPPLVSVSTFKKWLSINGFREEIRDGSAGRKKARLDSFFTSIPGTIKQLEDTPDWGCVGEGEAQNVPPPLRSLFFRQISNEQLEQNIRQLGFTIEEAAEYLFQTPWSASNLKTIATQVLAYPRIHKEILLRINHGIEQFKFRKCFSWLAYFPEQTWPCLRIEHSIICFYADYSQDAIALVRWTLCESKLGELLHSVYGWMTTESLYRETKQIQDVSNFPSFKKWVLYELIFTISISLHRSRDIHDRVQWMATCLSKFFKGYSLNDILSALKEQQSLIQLSVNNVDKFMILLELIRNVSGLEDTNFR